MAKRILMDGKFLFLANTRWMSEKLDGARAFWNGKKLLSKNGKDIDCPSWFVEGLPAETNLDGELWIERNSLEQVISILNGGVGSAGWGSVKYLVFDIPKSALPIEGRIQEMRLLKLPSHARVVEYQKCHGRSHIVESLEAITKQGGEGFMLCKPNSLYTCGRTTNLLKAKVNSKGLRLQRQSDTEVQVLEVLPGSLYCLQLVFHSIHFPDRMASRSSLAVISRLSRSLPQLGR